MQHRPAASGLPPASSALKAPAVALAAPLEGLSANLPPAALAPPPAVVSSGSSRSPSNRATLLRPSKTTRPSARTPLSSLRHPLAEASGSSSRPLGSHPLGPTSPPSVLQLRAAPSARLRPTPLQVALEVPALVDSLLAVSSQLFYSLVPRPHPSKLVLMLVTASSSN